MTHSGLVGRNLKLPSKYCLGVLSIILTPMLAHIYVHWAQHHPVTTCGSYRYGTAHMNGSRPQPDILLHSQF